MTLGDLRSLLDYHYWARDRQMTALEPLTADQVTRDMGSSFRSIHETLVHVLSAEWVWHSRWNGASPTAHLDPGDFPALPEVRARWSALESQVRSFVDAAGDAGIERVHDYRSLGGIPARSTLAQMVQHLVNHATYHRGQVTTMLRQMGAAPSQSLDLIAFFRERGL